MSRSTHIVRLEHPSQPYALRSRAKTGASEWVLPFEIAGVDSRVPGGGLTDVQP